MKPPPHQTPSADVGTKCLEQGRLETLLKDSGMRPVRIAVVAAALATQASGDAGEMAVKAGRCVQPERETFGTGFFIVIVDMLMSHDVLALLLLRCYANKLVDKQVLLREVANLDFVKCTVEELKAECRLRGLKVGGQKGELFARLALSPGFAGQKELQKLGLLRKRFGAGGMVVRLGDVLTVGGAVRMLEQWEKHKNN